MERLAVSRRLKDKVNLCLPAGDGLPIWTKIPMDSKLPMMKNPKGSVLFYTTRLGEPVSLNMISPSILFYLWI